MPSLAAMADNHYLISKSTQNGKTLTHVDLLQDDTDEVARLIGGNDYSIYAVPHAKEMKANAQRYKDSLKNDFPLQSCALSKFHMKFCNQINDL